MKKLKNAWPVITDASILFSYDIILVESRLFGNFLCFLEIFSNRNRLEWERVLLSYNNYK